MSLQILARSTDPDYTTTAAVKAAELGATATSTSADAYFNTLIRRSSRWADAYLGQPLSVATYRETVAAYGRRSLMLSRTPIRAIIAVYDATDTGTATALLTSEYRVEDADAGLISRDAGFPWSATMGFRIGSSLYGGEAIPLDPFPAPAQEFRPWLVDYVAGYSYDGIDPAASANWSTGGIVVSSDTGRTLPEDIEAGIIDRVQSFYRGASDTEREKLGDLEVNYRSLGTDPTGRLITRYETLLDPYRRVR